MRSTLTPILLPATGMDRQAVAGTETSQYGRQGMRKEAKRSLLLWPAAASTVIVTMSWLSTIERPTISSLVARASLAAFQQHGRQWPSPVETLPAPSVMHDRVEAPGTKEELVERSEHGTRAMKVPDRLATLLQQPVPKLAAPIRDESQELAGVVPPRQENSSPVLDADLLNQILSHPITSNVANSAAEALQAIKSLPVAMRRPTETKPSFVGPPRPTTQIVNPPADDPLRESVLPKSIAVLSKTSSPPQPPKVTIDVDQAASATRRVMEGSPAGWPVTARLDEQLKLLTAVAIKSAPRAQRQLASSTPEEFTAASWSEDVSERLTALRSLQRLGDPRAGQWIEELSQLAGDGSIAAEKTVDRQQQVQWLRACHGLDRRIAVWQPVWQIVRSTDADWNRSEQTDLTGPAATHVFDHVRDELQDTGDADGWAQYLLLDDIEQALESEQVETRAFVAQRLLSRLQWHGLNAEHRRWLERESIQHLARLVRPWARTAVDYASLLSQIERQESDAVDLAAVEIASALQTLRFAENPAAVRVADSLNTYYRNANIRVAISEDMLQRMLPSIDPKSVPVRTMMFGSRVRGMSRIESDLRVALTPSPDRWSIQLQTLGDIQTRAVGLNGPVAVRTTGNSKFVAATPIEVSAQGVDIGDSHVDVRGATRLRGIRTDYDGWPLIGSLVRSIATSRYDSLKPQSNRLANRQIQSQVGREVAERLDQQVASASGMLGQVILGPLGRLQLDPKVVDMQTTDKRLLARYRLAGDWQLGAFTPRPRAPSDSLMSVQVHQSALNNTLEQLVPRDQPKSIEEMVNDSLELFGQSDAAMPSDIPDDVTIQFARTRPITVEIEEGRLWMTLRIMRLTRGDRLNLRRFIVRAAFRPEMDGMHASLVRDGHLRISGPGMSMRERLPVRAIFNKVLSASRPLPLTLPQLIEHPAVENLAVSQLELRDGWIAMAISEADAPRIALRP